MLYKIKYTYSIVLYKFLTTYQWQFYRFHFYVLKKNDKCRGATNKYKFLLNWPCKDSQAIVYYLLFVQGAPILIAQKIASSDM